jgi:hypothetical protein
MSNHHTSHVIGDSEGPKAGSFTGVARLVGDGGGDASLPVLIKGKAPPPLLSPANTAPPKTAIR